MGLANECECGQQQTMNHIDMCLLTKFEGRLQSLYDVGDNALNWLKTTVNTALAK